MVRNLKHLALAAAALVALASAAPAATVHIGATSIQGFGNTADVYAADFSALTPDDALWADGSAPTVASGNLSGVYQSPFNNTGLLGTQSYFSVTGSETLTFGTAQSGFSLLWGSIDSYNTIAFDNGLSFTGTDIVQLLGLSAEGTNYEQVALISFSFEEGSRFSSVTFHSSQPAFEFALAPTPAAMIPLPAAGWLLLAGAGAIAAIARRKSA